MAVLNVSLTDGTPAAEQTNGNGNGDAEEHFSDSEEEQMEDEVAEAEPTPVPEPEVIQEPAVVEPVVSASPEPLTAIRKRITDSRPPSSLSALPLVDRQVSTCTFLLFVNIYIRLSIQSILLVAMV